MEFTVIRQHLNKTTTIGEILFEGNHIGYTLEDKDRFIEGDCSKKVYGETAIPCGRYELKLEYSDHFKRLLPHIKRVPCYEGILIHGGNKSKDTLGCVLAGKNTNNIDTISDCHDVVENICNILRKEDKYFITIKRKD